MVRLMSSQKTSEVHFMPEHRADWELYKQANSPALGQCPEGTTSEYVDIDDQTYFEGCTR